MTDPMQPGDAGPKAGPVVDWATPPASEEPHVHPDEALKALMADLHHRIEVAAYYLAEKRGFAPGHALDDWLAAEEMIEVEDAARAAED